MSKSEPEGVHFNKSWLVSVSRLSQHYREFLLIFIFLLYAWIFCLNMSVCSTCNARRSIGPIGTGITGHDSLPSGIWEWNLSSNKSQCSCLVCCLCSCVLCFYLSSLHTFHNSSLSSHSFKGFWESMYKYKNKTCWVHFFCLCAYGPGMNTLHWISYYKPHLCLSLILHDTSKDTCCAFIFMVTMFLHSANLYMKKMTTELCRGFTTLNTLTGYLAQRFHR